MIKKKLVSVAVPAPSYVRLNEFLDDLQEAVDKIPEEFREEATITLSGDSDWGHDMSIDYYRPYTQEETEEEDRKNILYKRQRIEQLQREIKSLL